jgi:transposase InsO family protein
MRSKRRRIQDERIEKLKHIHQEMRSVYGARRLRWELRKAGEAASRRTVLKLMKIAGIGVKKKRRYKSTTDSNHNLEVAPNLLNRNFKSKQANECWVSDITYVPTREGWLYFVCFVDLFSRKIVGWSMSNSLEATFVVDAFRMACKRRGTAPSIVHSDRGFQYAAEVFRKELDKHPDCKRSMSRKANCLDNAVAESFFRTLKVELVYQLPEFKSREEARLHIFDFVEVFYNRKRLHSYLNYHSPIDFEEAVETV